MPTIQSEDPGERVHHPRHYNQHTSGVETIELIEHLPCNTANAVKYIWRCGLKATETPLRDLESAKWYTKREAQRIELYELEYEFSKTDVVWRSLARRVIVADIGSTLAHYLDAFLRKDFGEMIHVIEDAIRVLGKGRPDTERAFAATCTCNCDTYGGAHRADCELIVIGGAA